MADKKDNRFEKGRSIIYRPKQISVEEVRLSMCENLGRVVTGLEAKNHIKICAAINKAHYSISSTSHKKNKKSSKKIDPNRIFSLDDIAADNRAKKNLRDWCFYWEGLKDGRVMASTADYYQGINELRYGYKFGDERIQKKSISLMTDLKNDIKEKGVILATRLDFIISKNNSIPYAEITHRYNCQYKKEIKKFDVLIPTIKEHIIHLKEFAQDTTGLTFIQKLFNTTDPLTEILLNLSYTTGITSDKLNLLIPFEFEQKKKPHMVIGLKILKDKFFIIASKLNKEGYSRGFKSIH